MAKEMVGEHLALKRLVRGVMIAAACLASFALRAEIKLLDGIVAVVDDDVVLASELDYRVRAVRDQLMAGGQQMPPADILVNQVLERLILESIQLQMGERAGVRIDDETLTRAITGIAERNGMTIDSFIAQVESEGFPYPRFREEVRRDMVISRVQGGQVNRRISLTEQEVESFLESPLGQRALSDEYRVGHILLEIARDATPAARRAAEEEADEIVGLLRSGSDFRELAIERSASASALEGGDMGWRKAGALPSLFAEAAVALQVGETADAIRSESGFHIIQLLDKRGVGVELVEQVNVRHILIQPSEIRSDDQARELIEEIHERLMSGEAFADLARVYSDDPGSALAGGELGWAEPDLYVESFRDKTREVEIGELSEPFRSTHGWHVLEVLERREQDLSEEARRNTALNILRNRRFEEELQSWYQEIRNEAYVDIRN
ncbi:MAG: peptidylprolyl isomerase [Gammaproteobacteria bacterium]|nr:peptidylprolyl isomerase [Gammaproteobacteria bacterium]